MEIRFVALRPQVSAFDAGVGNARGDELDGANGVVVPGDRIRDMVGIAVAVEDRDDRNLQPGGFLHGDLLDSRVEHEDGAGKATHVLDAGQEFLEFDDFFLHSADFFFRQTVLAGIGEHAFQLLHLVDAAPDGLEVRQHAAEPALIHVKHVGAQGFFLEDFRRLPLGSDKQDRLPGGDGVADEGIGLFHPCECLLQIDDVDAVAFAKEELLHLRVPPVRLVAEMDTSFQ